MNINEIFYSIQGEGRLMGLPTIFIRTTGCNLRCSYCDTTYAYEQGTEMTLQEIFNILQRFPCSTLCITGGEPLLQKDLMKLIVFLIKKRYHISIETNGSMSVKQFVGKPGLMISLDIKCPSSQMQDRMHITNLSLLSKNDQVKFILKNKKDYLYAKEIITKYKPLCQIFFQPVWGTDPKKLSSWVLHDGLSVHVGVQLHKVIWGLKKGV